MKARIAHTEKLLSNNLISSYGQPTTHSLIGDYVTPELARLGESVAGLVFPLIMFTVVPGYRRFRSVVDNHDVLDDDRDEKEYSEEPAHHGHVTRLRFVNHI